MVYLVGAGPGDPGLLTLRGADRIGRADVIVYDRLVHTDILRHARAGAEQVYVGKQSSRHTMAQEEITALIVQRAQSGQVVCRLKGGDPFVFGRGGEEAEACAAAGVPFEIVPGVTSAIAAPAYAGIPLTHREMASSFAVITGHERSEASADGEPRNAAEASPRWESISQAADTLVFLMGVENLGEIARQLIAHGRDSATPVALVRWGSWPGQETLVSTLGAVERDAAEAGVTPPAVLVVGEVVRLRERLRWFDNRPLFGRRILVTRAREQASALSDLLREHGADPLEFPVIRIVANAVTGEIDAALARLPGSRAIGAPGGDAYAWVVFTSANAVSILFDRLAALGSDSRAFGACRVAAIGPATAEALIARGIRPDFVPSRFVAETALDEWPEREMAGVHVLIPRAKEARDVLPAGLRTMGAAVDVVTIYETVRDTAGAGRLRSELMSGHVHAVTFTSSSTVKNLVESIGQECAVSALEKIAVACIGPITAQTARECGIEPDIVAEEFSIPGLVEALARHMEGRE